MAFRSWRLGVLSLVAAIVIAASAAAGAGARTEKASAIKIGTIMSLTGPLAVFGIQEKQAIQLAIKQANGAGGINGHKIDWTVYDAAGDTAQGVALTRRLVDNDGAQVIVGGGASSGVALAMEQILSPRGIFFASGEADPTITDPVTSNPTTFQTTVRSSTVVEALLSYAKAHGAKTIGVMGDTGAFGQSGITAAQDAAGKYGVTIKSASYNASSTDLTPQLKQLDDAGAQAIIIWTAGASGVIAIKNAAALNLKQMIMTAHSYANPTFMKQAGDAAKGVVVPVVNATVYHQATSNVPKTQKKQILAFANLYKKAFNQQINIYAAEAYDAANVALRALRLTHGNTDGRAMAAALEKAGPYVGVMGTFHFSKTDHYGLASTDVRIAKWSGAGWVLQKS